MSAQYEFWLCDDYGRRMVLLEDWAFFSYARTTQGLGPLQFALPFEKYVKDVPSLFKPDWRIDVWRSPDNGIAARREGSFLLRRYQVYERESDSMNIIELFGRSPVDLLRRQSWETNAVITGNLDNVMKSIVRGKFVSNPSAASTAPTRYVNGNYVYTGEFAVDTDAGDGPTISWKCYLQNIFDTLNNLRKTSFALNAVSSANRKIYFDVVEDVSLSPGGNGFGYRFRTFPDLRGKDRTAQIIFSPENGNFISPVFYEDFQDEITAVSEYNSSGLSASVTSDDQYLSRWNFIQKTIQTAETDPNAALADAYAELKKGNTLHNINGSFFNSPGSDIQPRSLYGIDWDLGDLLRVKFAGKSMDTEVAIVYVSMDSDGKEKITGKSQIGQ